MTRLSRPLTVGICVLVAMLGIACADETTAPDRQFVEVSHEAPGKPLGFTRCTPQPSSSSSERIGPSGGTIRAGRHTLRIPAGALNRSVVITMEAPSDSLNYVVFGPEGLTFDPANLPTLVMSYRNCAVNGPQESWLEIVYADDALTTVLDTTESTSPDPVNRTVGAKLKHFSRYVLKSRYAVAY